LPQLMIILARALRDLREFGPTPQELEAARASYMLSLDMIASNTSEAARYAAHMVFLDDQWIDEDLVEARTATHERVRDFARQIFRSKTGHLVIIGPREEDDLKAAWRSFESGLAD
jgi:secreted Zn-dependent insulinase-like peptidase